MFIIFDTETTGLPRDFNAPVSDSDNWPRLVQLAWQIHDEKGELVEVKNFIVKPDGFDIPYNAEKIHGISTERALKQGCELDFVLDEFNKALNKSDYNVGHNIGFDINIMGAEYYRRQKASPLMDLKEVDTKSEATAAYCQIPGGRGGKFKWPTLTELHTSLFKEGFNEAHNASADVEATARCFLELVRLGVITADALDTDQEFVRAFREANPKPFELIGLNIQPYAPEDLSETEEVETADEVAQLHGDVAQNLEDLKNVPFSHLHNHSQFSILQSTTEIKALVQKAVEYKMPGIGLTDHGNMMAAFHFVREVLNNNRQAEKQNKAALENGEPATAHTLKPVLGCELSVCKDHLNKNVKDNGQQQVFIAKTKNGYHNLAKLSSTAFVEGFYYVPRIDKQILLEYKEGLITTTGSLYSEVPHLILNVGEAQAEEAFLWWKEQFQDDFYVELLRHGQQEEDHVNKVLLKFAQKHNVKYFAANNSYYINKEDAQPHDILLCVKDAELQSTPIGKGRGFRFGFPNQEYYMKSPDEMKELFKDLPEAIKTTNEIVDKIEVFDLARDVLLPAFDIPEEFVDPKDEEDGGKRGENAFLRHITYEGAKKRYEEITDEIRERLDFELDTIANTGYPGYFLIVQDFTSAARDMGVSVGPGRGSAAGSAVAYCVGITNVDPIAYDLLFERFLNPDRVSLPDIDIDFDDVGRGKIIDWVVDKYGSSQVAQIITYGTMAAKSSIRDTARVLNLPLPDADRIAKLVPDIKLKKLFGLDEEALKEKLNAEDLDKARQLKEASLADNLEAQTINQARILEGSVRNTGIHACGVIITPDDITKFVPVSTAKDSDLYVTQFDNSVVEDAGLLKMDFLGLKTLTIIKDAVALVKENHGVEIDPDEIPLDDVKTYELYQRGETNGTFQFESPGMQKHLKALKPDKFGDLIAMNALYRPGPLEYIPNFIARKHGLEEITYDAPEMEDNLAETYGITVYQEQVMLLSQKLAGFTKGMADSLRKAMGKKKKEILDQLKPKFIDGCAEKNIKAAVAEKIWGDWEAFAAYAFNKSHSTCYSVVAFHTAYLKAHYPAEYMASVLTNNMNDIKKVTFFMEECVRMGIPVLGPDINESGYKFRVNDQGAIRFGLGALKGVGEGAVEAIVNERGENGHYLNIFDLTKRIDLRACNKKALESITLGGGFDSFAGIHRAQYFNQDQNGRSALENAVKFGQNHQENINSAQQSLFGGESVVSIPEPAIPPCEEWSSIQTLNKEKEVVGIYISGHPLDDYKLELNSFCSGNLGMLDNMESLMGREVKLGGIVTDAAHRISKKGTPFGIMTLEDYHGVFDFFLFGETYAKFKHFLNPGWFLFLQGKVEKPWKTSDKLDFKITRIELLTQLREKLARNLNIQIEEQHITEAWIQEFHDIIAEHQGTIKLHLTIVDKKDKMKVNLFSKSNAVNLSQDLLKKLDSMEEVFYKVS